MRLFTSAAAKLPPAERRPPVPGRPWLRPVIAITSALIVLALTVLAARWSRELPAIQSFLTEYPGYTELPAAAPIGLPVWLTWQHFLNAFFIVLIIKSGWQVRTNARTPAHWTRNNTGLIRTKNPPTKISLDLWLHLTLDALWVLNGIIFVVVLFTTGHWMRIIPTSWDIFPNAASAAMQYLALAWPTENGWVNYNSLQVIAYFTTVFIAAPLAFFSGLRMSPVWPKTSSTLNSAYPIEAARAVHIASMGYFVVFVVVHVTLVLATGAIANLNHMYASRDDGSWAGLGMFALSLLVTVAAWFLARPLFLRPIASMTGKVTR